MQRKNIDDDDANARASCLDYAFMPVLEMYATLSMQPGFEFSGSVYPNSVGNAILHGNVEYLKALCMYGAGYSRFLNHVEDALLMADSHKAELIIAQLVAAHVEFDKRPLTEFVILLQGFEKPLRPQGIGKDVPRYYASRLFYFYEKLLAARGVDRSITLNLGCLFLGVNDLRYLKTLEDQVKTLKTMTQYSLDYYKYHFDDPSLVQTMLPYLDNAQLVIRSNIIFEQFKELLEQGFLSNPNYVWTPEQMMRLMIVKFLNKILHKLTAWTLFTNNDAQAAEINAYFNGIIDCDRELSTSAMGQFFAEITRRMNLPQGRLNADPKLLRLLQDGYVHAVKLRSISDKNSTGVLQMLQPAEQAPLVVNEVAVAQPSTSSSASNFPVEVDSPLENPFPRFFAEKKSLDSAISVEMQAMNPSAPPMSDADEFAAVELVDDDEQLSAKTF